MAIAKKLLLVSAIALASSSAFAMQALDEDSMSEATGQDGITLSILTPALGISMETRIHDSNGITGITGVTGLTNAGVIVMGGAASSGVKTSIVTPTVPTQQPITVLIDAGAGASGATPTLNVNVGIPTGTIINTGTLSVAASGGMGSAITNQTGVILQNAQITLGATSLNIQLGNAPQGDMIKLDTSMTGGLTIANFALNDTSASGGSSISATSLSLRDTGGGANLTVKAGAGVKTTGLYINLTQLGTAAGGFDQRISGLRLGTAPAIGDVEVIGLNLNGSTLTIAGH